MAIKKGESAEALSPSRNLILPLDHHRQKRQERIDQGLQWKNKVSAVEKQEELLIKIVRCLSKKRLESYFKNSSEEISVALSRYLWNIALSESLYPSLNVLEIALRNELFTKLSQQFGKEWLFYEESAFFRKDEQRKITQAKSLFKTSKQKIEPERLVPELNFGFWTGLFNGYYEMHIWRIMFSSRANQRIFPFLPRRIRTRNALSKKINHIRKLRNRIFHHEPIWHKEDLAQTHLDILETVYWISPELCSFLHQIDKFPNIFKSGQRDCMNQVELVLRTAQAKNSGF